MHRLGHRVPDQVSPNNRPTRPRPARALTRVESTHSRARAGLCFGSKREGTRPLPAPQAAPSQHQPTLARILVGPPDRVWSPHMADANPQRLARREARGPLPPNVHAGESVNRSQYAGQPRGGGPAARQRRLGRDRGARGARRVSRPRAPRLGVLAPIHRFQDEISRNFEKNSKMLQHADARARRQADPGQPEDSDWADGRTWSR